MPAAVVFDVGNVLYHWDPAALYAPLIPDAAERDWFLANIVTPEWHFQHDAGARFADTSDALIARHPDYAPLIAAWGPRFDDTIIGPVPGVLALLDALHAAGVPLYAITNFSAEFWPPFRAKRADVFAKFRDIIVSGEERMVKPDPAIYKLALSRFELAPGTALFIDDRADNVAAAAQNGFIGHHFSDAATLAADLRLRGLLEH